MFLKYKISIFFVMLINLGNTQELYPLSEPASNVPKGVFGIRSTQQSYNEYGSQKYLTGLKVLYGLTGRLSLSANISFSNHHSGYLPLDLITHTSRK